MPASASVPCLHPLAVACFQCAMLPELQDQQARKQFLQPAKLQIPQETHHSVSEDWMIILPCNTLLPL